MNNKKILLLVCLLALTMMVLVACGAEPEITDTTTLPPTSQTSSSTSSSSSSSSTSSSQSTTSLPPFPEFDDGQCYNHARNRNPLTCDGTTECSVCGEPLAAIAHMYAYPGVYTEGDCQTLGYTTHKCMLCGETMRVDDEDFASHHYEGDGCTVCGASALVTVEKTEFDEVPMPDRYNTGANNVTVEYVELTKVYTSGIYNGVSITYNNGTYSLNPANSEKEGNTIYIDNLDFSYGDKFYAPPHNGYVIHFRNCILNEIQGFRSGAENCQYIFEDCNLIKFGGSNATLIDVNFGGADDRDGIVPFQNVTAINCYVGDKAPINYQRELHTDAIQIYGYGMKKRETEAVNLHFYNFRAEMPSIPYTGSHSYMNSCLMVSLDYNNGYNITFTHCYVNGTGCPVMIWDNPHPDYIEGYPNHTPNYMKDVVYTDIRSGCGSQFTTLVIGLESEESAVTLGNKTYGKGTSAGKVYSSMPENFEIKTDTLLVGSVWEKDGKTHVSVTNDTSKIRTLAVVTSAGTVHRLTVDRFPLYFELERDLAFTELPIDIDFAIDGTYDWIACFDTTEGQFRQIRFVSKTEETVEINSSILFDHRVENGEVYEIAHGMLSGTSSSDREAADKQAKMNGVFFNITSDGTMLIYGYTSDAEIKSLRNYSIGSYNKADYMAYADLIKHVVIKPGITNIPAGMFKGMTSIETITLPSTVTTIGDEAFAGCYSLRSINIPYGMKRIGVKAFAECYALEEAVIPSTVTNVGARAFERCASLEKVVFAPKMSTLPDSIFNRCYALKEIVLTSNLTQIPSASFQNCISLEKLSFVGDEIALRSIAYTSRQNALFAEIHRGEVTYLTDDDLALLEDRTLKSREPQPTNSVNKTQVAKVYDGKPLTTNFTTDSDGEVTYKWMKGAMILDGAPCDAGRYTLVIKVAETEKFQAYEVHLSVYINPAPASLTITTPSLDKPFDGTPPEAPQFTTNSSGSVTVTWYVGNMACKEAPIAPGEYRVVVTVAANNNYGATSAQMKVTIGLPEGMSYWDGTTATGFAGGNGTQESPYQIATAEQLSYLAAMVNSSEKNAEFADKYYVLTQDIYLNQAASSYSGWTDAKVAPEGVNEWMSIGSTKDTKFKGHFDGQNHIIYGLYSRATEAEGETYHNGLFGYVETAAIENLIIRYGALVDTLANKHKSGYLAAFMDGGTYRNVYVRDVYTNGTTTVGGLFGEAQAKAGDALIENCHFNGELIGNNAGNFGGIIGSMNGGARGVYFTIRGCTTRGEIYARNGAAGMIGSVSTNINLLMEDCYNYANIEVWGSRASGMLTNASSTMGGLEVVIRQCVNYGDITVADDRAAGILSSLEPNNIPVTIENCANYGTITANQYAGGIVAYLAGTSTGSITMANNFSLGSVSATTYGNELIGYLNPGHAPLSIQNCGFIGNNFATNEGNLEGTVEVTPEDLRDYLEALNAYVAANLDAKPTLRPWILADHGLQFQGELRLDTNNLDKYVDDKPAETPSFTRLYGDGEIVITWWKGNEQLSGAPTEPGDYRVVITMADTLAVKGTSVALDFALSAVGTPTLRINGIDKAYDGTPVALPEISTTNVDATPTFTFYRGEIGAGEKLDGAPTDAGTYYVVVSVPASNGFDAVEKSKAFVISKAQSVIEGLSNPTREYNGEAIKLPAYTYNGTAEVMVQFYRGTYKRRGELLEGAPTEVGNYVVIFTAPEETNYTGVEVYYDFRIDLITSFVSIEESLTKVATGEAISAPAYTTTQSGGEVTISWYDNEGNLLETAPSEAGFYEVVIRLAQNGNYSAAEASQAFELIATGQTWTGEIGVAFAGGTGTAEDPFQIATAEQLAYLAALVNAASTYNVDENGLIQSGGYLMYASAHYILVADIVLNDGSENYENWIVASGQDAWVVNAPANVWKPIGDGSVDFSGVFDGDGHSITGLYIHTKEQNAALFGTLKNATIKDLTIKQSATGSANRYGRAAILAAYAPTAVTIENCRVEDAVVCSYETAGGLVAAACGDTTTLFTIRDTYVDAKVYALYNISHPGESSRSKAGILVGATVSHGVQVRIENCETHGLAIAYNAAHAFIQFHKANPALDLIQCVNYATITATNGTAAGFVSVVTATSGGKGIRIRDCVNYGDVTGDTLAAGMLGSMSGAGSGISIQNCINYGAVTATAENGVAGGIIGTALSNSRFTIQNTISAGTVTGATVGEIWGSIAEGKLATDWAKTLVYYVGNNKVGGAAPADMPEVSATKITLDQLVTEEFLATLNAWATENSSDTHTYKQWVVIDGRIAHQ